MSSLPIRLGETVRAAILGAALAACSEGTATSGLAGPAAVVTVSIASTTRSLTIGQSAQLSAIGRDRDGKIVADRMVAWISDAPLVASVTEQGLVAAHRAGSATISADIDGRTSSVVFIIAEVSVASVSVTPGVAALTVGGTRQLVAMVQDAAGNILTNRNVGWTTSNASVVSVSATGFITARAAGFATITVESDARRRTVPVTVCSTTGLYVTGIHPAALSPGGKGTIAGCNFAPTPGGNTVTVDGTRLVVESATPTELIVAVPAALQYECVPERQVTLSVSAGSAVATRLHRWATAKQHALGVGDAVTLLDAVGARCNELVGGGSRYFISVFNTTGLLADQTSVILRGLAGAPLVAAGSAPSAATRAPDLRTSAPSGFLDADRAQSFQSAQASPAAHGAVLDASTDIAKALGAPARYRARRGSPGGAAAGTARSGAPSLSVRAAAPAVGDIVAMRVWKHDSGSCNQFDEISTRTVYVGTRSIIREDVAAPLAGMMDDYFGALGREFDATMFPLLAENFGNPLVLDPQLDANGRIIMVFTRRVNDDGLAGFVISCDFYPRGVAPSSNEGEVFYAFVPTDPTLGYPSGLLTRDKWRREIRSTLVHEAKHITSFAERFSRDASFEEGWLEEGSAMHAEELWSRASYGSVWKGNTTYATSLYCDVRQARPECADRPYVMLSHFSLLYDYLASVETLSPLGSTGSGDYSYYGSAWAFVRWIIDHHAASDASFLKPLTQGTAVGLENVAQRTSRTFGELIGDWSLAMAVDDYPNVVVARPELSFPSWQTRDIFAAMNRDYAGFPRPVPLATRPVQFGAFTGDVTLRGGTAALFELSGTQLNSQLLELRTAAGGPPPANMRIAIIRVQ